MTKVQMDYAQVLFAQIWDANLIHLLLLFIRLGSFFSNCAFFGTGVILLKAQTRQSVAILGVKSNRFLCMDTEGNLFSSVSF